MSRLLVNSEKGWCYKLSEVGFYGESEFEDEILLHVKSIFPEFITVTFKRNIVDREGKQKKPDLVLIRRDFKEWWIVEIELEIHPVEHVRTQVSVFLNGDYSDYDGLAKYISDQISTEYRLSKVPINKIRRLVEEKIPSVLIVVDSDKEDWEREFRVMNVTVCVFEIYKNNKSQYSYRLRGNYPYVVKKESPCRFDPKIPRVLQILEPSILKGRTKEIEISYNGEITKWSIFTESDGGLSICYVAREPIPLTTLNTYVLKKSGSNRFFLERS